MFLQLKQWKSKSKSSHCGIQDQIPKIKIWANQEDIYSVASRFEPQGAIDVGHFAMVCQILGVAIVDAIQQRVQRRSGGATIIEFACTILHFCPVQKPEFFLYFL